VLSPVWRRFYIERFWVHARGTVIRSEGEIVPEAEDTWTWTPTIEYDAAGQRFRSSPTGSASTPNRNIPWVIRWKFSTTRESHCALSWIVESNTSSLQSSSALSLLAGFLKRDDLNPKNGAANISQYALRVHALLDHKSSRPSAHVVTSAKCQWATSHSDHLVGADEKGLRKSDTERFSSLEI
jgi:hypothetical protein